MHSVIILDAVSKETMVVKAVSSEAHLVVAMMRCRWRICVKQSGMLSSIQM